jgi:hypothetical protein
VLDANGTVGNGVYQSVFKTGNLGGGSGGKAWSDNTSYNNVAPKHGTGPTHLVGASPFNSGGSRKKGGTLSGLVAGTAAGGGGYGGAGARSEASGGSDNQGAHPISGQGYGNINVDALLAGSGGGGGEAANGGTGAGAIKITAGGTLTIGADIYAEGGQGGHSPDPMDGFNGPTFWFDASDETSVSRDSNGKVSYWKDKNGDKHLSQSTASKQPTYGTRTYNGLNVVDFDGTDYLDTINAVGDKPGRPHSSFWIVAYIDSVDSVYDSLFCVNGSNDKNWQFEANHASQFLGQLKFSNGHQGTNKTFFSNIVGQPVLIGFRSNNAIEVRLNGKWMGNTGVSQNGDNSNILRIGANRGGDQPIDGWVGEIVGGSHYPYGSWTQKIERYLLGKWGIDSTLSSATSERFNANEVGGAGSGGSIYLKAANLVVNNDVTISANGGKAAPGINTGGNTGATDGGGEGPAAGGGGRVYLEGTTSFLNHASATNANITANGGQSQAASGTPRHGEDGTVRVVRPQVSSLVFTDGTLTIDADSGEITHSDGSFLLGEFSDKTYTDGSGNAYPYQIVTFTADTISLGSGVVVNLTGSNAISLRTRNHGALTLGTTINVNGGNDPSNVGGSGKAGGFDGGAKDVDGNGPGKGKTKSVNSAQGGGAAFGGQGKDSDLSYSQTYATAELSNHLLGGSGGGGGDAYGGGAGGGAVELFAHGDGALTITSAGKILANGGDTSTNHAESGGGGSGGAIRLEGGSISIAGTLEAKGGNGLTATPGGGGRIAIKTNGNLTLGTIKLDGHRPGTLHISGSTPTAALSHSSGTLTIDTTYGYWTHSGGTHGVGVIEDKVDDGIEYKTCSFSFPSINLATGLTVNLQGENSLILKTTNNGDISIGTTLSVDGGNSQIAYPGFYRDTVDYGMGKLGGYNGGTKNSSNGYGPGAGKLSVNGTVGGGGGYGSNGQYQSTDTTFGNTYGSPYIAHLHGGSGGGAGAGAGGGAGGGAISLEADGNGTLTITSGGNLSANGGNVAGSASNGGGGGSGGSIRLSGKTISNNGTIQAKGATPPHGGIGGGGRVVFAFTTNLTLGSVDVGTGAQEGTITENTPPTISSGSTATATFSNLNYRKNSATRFNDLAFWYSFDEASGATANDFSNNGRDATLKNMTAANRVGGKIGNALSFDTPKSKTSSDASGQHLDLGTWSFGGSHTYTAWVKVDEWRSKAPLLFLSGSNEVNIGFDIDANGKLGGFRAQYKGTAGGDESFSSGNSFVQWGQWIHLAIVQSDEGTNLSTTKFYKNGTIFATSSAGKTAPDAVSRTPLYIGRSDASNNYEYFAGDLDEVRLYKVALSADEVSAVYAETNGTTWYTVTSNSGTDYSATGLPSGLSINPTTGEISGNPTAIGDHNITVTASNLAGSDSKVVTITVDPTTPLLKSAYTVTRESDLLGWFKFDETTGSTATNYGSEGSAATLMSGAVFSTLEKKFGASSLSIPSSLASNTSAQARITTPIDVGDNSASNPYSLSAWFKGLYDYSQTSQGWRTLTRGSGANHQVIVNTNSDELGTHTGWVGSGYNLTPEASDNAWQHLVATFDGSRTKFYIDGSYVGQLDASMGNNIYAVGNHSGGQQRFAEYLDDFRVYGVTLSAADITNIYGRGNGDVFPVTAGSSYATATATLLETGGADTTVTVVYDSADKGTSTTSPTDFSGISLWLDASDLSTAGSTWLDKSGNANHATKNGSPTLVTNAANGLGVMRYSGANSDYHSFTQMTDIRTVFWVIKAVGSNQFLLGDNSGNIYHFHNNGSYFWNGSHTSANIINGTTRLNGSAITGTSTAYPSSFGIISLKTTGNVTANNFSRDRTQSGRNWNGDLGEIIIFNTALSDDDIVKVESYLGRKWGISVAGATGWANSYTLPNAQSAGDVALSMNGLSASTNYVFRIAATNSKGTTWSDAYSVLTNSQAQPPAISAETATSVAGTTATTNGDLLSYDGSDLPSIRLYYGDDIDFQLGWREAHLTGDTDSGISSSHTYTAAVNVGSALSITINGVSFAASGDNASTNSGTGWTITQGWGAHGSDAWVGGNTTYQSTVGGNIGSMLDKGFRHTSSGGYQKIKMTGLTDGKVYTFTTYSQSWGGSRTMKVNCSDLPGATFAFNQDKYQDSPYDGYLLECTYVADGTEAEFTFQDVSANFHLYAFSNRVASSSIGVDVTGFSGTGALSKSLSSLSAGSRYEYAFVATNNGGAAQSNTNSFVTLGLPQVLTPGATDVTKTSVTLNIDLNSTGGATYTTGEPFSGTSVPGLLMWMDGDDPDGDGTPNTSNYNLVNGTGWQDKSGNGRHASNVDGSPSFVTNELNGKGVVYFNGTNNAYISSSSSLAAHTENFSIFLISKDEGTGSHSAHVQSPYNNNSWSFGAKQGHTKNVAWFNGWLYPQSQDADSADTTNFHLYQATLTDTDSGNVWLDGQKVMTDGTGANDGTNRKPGQISFGGDNRGNHTRSKCRIAEFIVLNRVVSEAERLKIEGYLTRKWGMMNTMFSAAHPYYSSDPYQPTVTQGGEDAAVTFYWGDNNASTTPGTTSLNFATGQGKNDDLSNSFGSNLSSSTSGATVTNGGTPNIALSWTAPSNVLEVHGQGNTYWSQLDSGSSAVNVLQLDLDGGEADPYITFSVSNGKSLFLDSVEIGQGSFQSKADHAWTLSITKVGGSEVFSHTTAVMGAGDKELVRFNFTGESGTNYILKFSDNGSNGNHGGIDNLKFGEIDWDNSYILTGTHGVGVVTHALSGLTTGTTYYYTAKAFTSAGTSWGPVQTFVPANTALNKYSIPDLALWVDATDLNGDGTTDNVTNGSAVSAWTDKSLTNATVNQSTTGNQPTRQTNAFGTKSAVRFDGTNDFLNISSLRASNGEYSAYAAVRRGDQSGDNNGYLIGASDWNLMPSSSNAPFPAIVAETKGSSGTLTNLKIGKSTSTTTNDFGGDLGELLIFSRQLTSTEEQKVQGYLAHKWGGTAGLDANHPYKNVAPIFDNKPLIRDISEISNSSITNISGMEVWFDASDLDADGITDSTASGNISSWYDKSGNDRHALTANGTPELKTTSGPSNGRVVEIRGGDYLPVSGSFFVKDMFFVFRSPPANTVWSGYGGPFGRNPSSGHNLRGSNYITQHNQTYFHSSQYPAEVYKNGTALSGNFNLGTITNYMIVRLIVNDNDTSNNSYHNIGRVTGLQCNLDIAEIVAFNSKVSNADAALVEGYMAVKWGLTSALPSGHNYKSYTSWPDVLITTGQPVNLQILADRNPTSWSASGLASGLSINNSGLISGSVSSLSAFNSTVTASNSDGNDSKSITFGVSKGYRVIDWNQTFAGLVYGDSPLSLTATATGTGDLNYTSSDSDIIEINGTSAIIRGGGSVTLTATAAENSTAFAAVPVSHTFSVAKAPLTITGQDLSLSVGDSIPDLNCTVTGWKHSDASAAIGANPAALPNLALWLDASDTSTITHTSNAVSQWSDKSGNSNHATQSTSGSKPLFDTNQILFDGSNDSLTLAHGVVPDSNQASMVFLVANCDATSGNDGFITNGRFTSAQSFSYRTNGTSQVTWYSWGNDLVGVSSTSNSPLKVHALELSVTGNTFKIYHDGTLKGTKSSFTGTANAGSETGFLGRTSTNEYLEGSIKEVIISKQEPSDSVRKSVEGYLAHKWGLVSSLPSNHTHKEISLLQAPVVTTDATSSSSAGTYYIRPGDAASNKYSFTYVDGDLVLSSLTEQSITWGQDFSGVGVGQTVDLNASATSGIGSALLGKRHLGSRARRDQPKQLAGMVQAR